MAHEPVQSGDSRLSESLPDGELTTKTGAPRAIGDHPSYGYLKLCAELLERSPGALRELQETELVSHVLACAPCQDKVQRRLTWRWLDVAVSADEELSERISREGLLRPRVADALSVLERGLRRQGELSGHFRGAAGGRGPELESVVTWFSACPVDTRAQLLFHFLADLVSPEADTERDEIYRLIRHRLREAARHFRIGPRLDSGASWASDVVEGFVVQDLQKECLGYQHYAKGTTTAEDLLQRLTRIEPYLAIRVRPGSGRSGPLNAMIEDPRGRSLLQQSLRLPQVAVPGTPDLLRNVNRALDALVRAETRMRAVGVPSSLSAEDLLQELANRARDEVSAYACSIYMRDEDASLYVLKESTTLTPFIGRSVLDQTRAMDEPRCGITAWCATMGRSHLSPDVRKDEKWSSFGLPPRDISREDHCELTASELASLIVVPLNRSESPDGIDGVPSSRVTAWPGPLGVLRVVRRHADGPFTPEDERKLEALADDFKTTLTESQSFARLMDVGLTLDVGQMCNSACRVLAHLIRAKGVSIFLLDESKENGQLIYRCRGTTGLQVRDAGTQRVLGPEEALYKVPHDANTQLTAYVAQRKRNVMIDDVFTYDFKTELGIERKPGPGKFGERFRRDPSKGAGPVMLVPLFFRERFDDFPAMGVLRASRPEGGPTFEPAEQRRFLALADHLARAILRNRYRELLQDIALAQQPVEEILAKVAREVPKLLGGRGCSIFVGNPTLKIAATSGTLEGQFAAGEIVPYDVRDSRNRGITGAAVALKKTIRYNCLEDRAALEREGIQGSGRNLCEIRENPPKKLIVAPLLAGGACMGAIRIPKTSAQARFSDEDVALLEDIGRHLGVLVANGRALRKARSRTTSQRKAQASSRGARSRKARPRSARGRT